MRDLISQALVRIMSDFPFFSQILLRLRIEESKTLPAIMGVSSTTLYYNEEVFKEHNMAFGDVKVLTTILVHEALHVAMKHTVRMAKIKIKYGDIFKGHFASAMNEAMDLAINSLLRREHSKEFEHMLNSTYQPLMPTVFPHEKYMHDKTFEEYAKQMAEEYKAEEGKDNRPMHDRLEESGKKDQMSIVIPSEDDDLESEESDLDNILAGASNTAKAGSNMCQMEKKLIDDIVKPPVVNWRLAINNFIQSRIYSGETYQRLSRRNCEGGIVMPSNESTSVNNIVLLSDQSGSITDKEVNEIKVYMESLLKIYRTLKITFVPFDSRVDENNVREYSASNLPIKEVKRTRSGGTMFVPPLRYAGILEGVSGVIMVTDMLPCDRERVNDLEIKFPLLYLDILKSGPYDWGKLIPKHGRVIKVEV